MKRYLIPAVAGLALIGSACSVTDSLNESRGRGDAGVAKVDDSPKEVIQFPDRFSNVSHACDGYGHRVYVSTKSDGSRQMDVIDDPTCR